MRGRNWRQDTEQLVLVVLSNTNEEPLVSCWNFSTLNFLMPCVVHIYIAHILYFLFFQLEIITFLPPSLSGFVYEWRWPSCCSILCVYMYTKQQESWTVLKTTHFQATCYLLIFRVRISRFWHHAGLFFSQTWFIFRSFCPTQIEWKKPQKCQWHQFFFISDLQNINWYLKNSWLND